MANRVSRPAREASGRAVVPVRAAVRVPKSGSLSKVPSNDSQASPLAPGAETAGRGSARRKVRISAKLAVPSGQKARALTVVSRTISMGFS